MLVISSCNKNKGNQHLSHHPAMKTKVINICHIILQYEERQSSGHHSGMVVGTTYAISAHQHLSCKLLMAFYSIQHYVTKVVNDMQHAKRFHHQ
jgi:hypothetical protein